MAPQCFLHLTGVCLHLGWQLPLAHGRAGDARGYSAAPSPVLCPGFCSELCDGNAASHRGHWEWSPADIELEYLGGPLVCELYSCMSTCSIPRHGWGGAVGNPAELSCVGWGLQAAPAAMFSSQSLAVLQVEAPSARWDLADGTERGHKAWSCVCPSR